MSKYYQEILKSHYHVSYNPYSDNEIIWNPFNYKFLTQWLVWKLGEAQQQAIAVSFKLNAWVRLVQAHI